MAQEVSEYLSQNPRVAAWVETLRCEGETDKHWRHRREFLLRNAGDLVPATDEAADAESGARRRQLQQLVSFSMAWANHVFLGCRYPQKVMDKILSMAEGIKVTDAPIHTTRDELVAKVKKRGISSSNEGVEEPSKKRAVEGKNNSSVERDHGKTAKTDRSAAQQENSSASRGSSTKSESGGTSARSSSSGSHQNSSTSEGDRSVCSQSSSNSSQVTAGSGKASDSEAPDKRGSASFVSSLLKSSMNSHMTQSTDNRQQSGSPQKGALEGSSGSASQSSSEIEVPLLGSSGSAEVELPLLSCKSSSETASSGLTSSSEANISSSVSKNSSSSGSSLLTPKSSSTNPSLLTSKSSAQVAASLLASKSSTSLGSMSQLASKSSSQSSTSQLPSKSTSQSSESSVKFACRKLTNEDIKQKQPFFNRLYKTVAWKLVAVGGFSPSVNHGELLNAAIEALKATLDVFFVPLKELADLPQNKSSQESIVCELRCKSVYLGTGCGKSKENAKAVASREALKLFLKKKVVVKICKRKYRGNEVEDLVLLDEESRPVNLPPALKHPQELL
ncbi:CDKN2A-interacting protein isoform X1 [Mus pahari]|uniref:CDKN2A-interacting protein isoform X1 n=1 Tax=Mus pahari TaxID=10093 RepID=UPI000A305520|nr:CDKN2A-interacting protein isoform X1 [Mus pahari]